MMLLTHCFRCTQHQNCSIQASTSLFADPCPGTLKYLEAHYQCVPGTVLTLIIRWHKNLISMNTFLVNHSIFQGVNRSRIRGLTPTVYIVFTAILLSLRCRKISSLDPQRSQASNTPLIIYVSIHIYLSLSIFLYVYLPGNEYTLTVIKVSVGMLL